jgi:uncharacterized protein Yka (UPF0111/DUF47 family)
MSMSIKDRIFPKSTIFYDRFEQLAALVMKGADELVVLTENHEDIGTAARIIKDIEHEGDKIAHEIYEELNVALVTPFPPQEIVRLASSLDDILDYIDGTVRKMEYYKIREIDSHMRELAKLIQLSVRELEEAVLHIRLMKNPRYIEKRCIEVNRLENIADEALAVALTDLFETNDAVGIIKLKDIYEWLEIATDKCEDAANVLSDIAIRHA